MRRFWDRSEYWIRKGDSACATRSWGTAARCYRKALKHNPDVAPIWVQYGHALKESGRMRMSNLNAALGLAQLERSTNSLHENYP